MLNSKKILIVDDNAIMGEVLSDVLTDAGYGVEWVGNGQDAIEKMGQESVHIVLLDLLLPGMNGIEVLKAITQINPLIMVIMMSGHGTIQTAVQATRLGAYEWLEKPLEKERVLLTVRNAVDKQILLTEKNLLLSEAKARYKMVGTSPHLNQVYQLIDRVAPTPSTVLITGESGTGKELVARAVHMNSQRAGAPLVQVNCAAVPETLIESELFGHVKGAFTGAIQNKKGRFQQAHGGTLFLDEIGDLSAMAQAKVLRAIESGEVTAIGQEQSTTVDIRLLAATNRDLAARVKTGEFREDLFHRINVIEIALEPLKNRISDIEPLLDYFLEQYANTSKRPRKYLDSGALGLCKAYAWPGNIRELRNFSEKINVFIDNNRVSTDDVRRLLTLNGEISPECPATLKEAKKHFERSFIQDALNRHNGNISHTAKELGTPRSLLYQKIDRYGLGHTPLNTY